MPLQDFETFKREHIDRPAVGDIWRHLESNELFQIMRSEPNLVQCKPLSDEGVIDISKSMNKYTFHTRAVSTNYINQPLEKKFIQYNSFDSSSKIIARNVFVGENVEVDVDDVETFTNFGFSTKRYTVEGFYNAFGEIESLIQLLRTSEAWQSARQRLEVWYDFTMRFGDRSMESDEEEEEMYEGVFQVVRGTTYTRSQFYQLRDYIFREHLYYDDMGADPSEDGKYSCDFIGDNKEDPVRLNSGYIYCFKEIKALLRLDPSAWKCPNSRADITSIHIMTQEEIDKEEKRAVKTEKESLEKLKECNGYTKKMKEIERELKILLEAIDTGTILEDAVPFFSDKLFKLWEEMSKLTKCKGFSKKIKFLQEEIKKKQKRLDDVRKSRDQPILKF